MSLINVTNLTFAYEGSYDNIFENVSLQIDTDWKLGFIGRNGRGKTTFLKLLQNKFEYQGSIDTNVSFDYFPYEIKDTTAMTMDILQQINSEFEIWQLKREISLLALSEDLLYQPFETLSGGEQVKMLLAVLFLRQNHFLLIDEPTNHLDAEARAVVSCYLQSKKGFILVSHDKTFLDRCINHVLVLNKTNIEIQKGNFSSWWANKEKQDVFEQGEHAKLLKEVKQLSSAAKRTSGWSVKTEKSKNQRTSAGLRPDKGFVSHKAAKLMKRAKSLEQRNEKLLSQKSKLLLNIESNEELKIHPLPYAHTNLAEFKNFSLFYGNKQICNPLNFYIQKGDRIALCGPNGSGKSTLLNFIRNQVIDYKGYYQIAKDLVISYVSQDTTHLQGNLSHFVEQFQLDEPLLKSILRKMDFPREQFHKSITHYSEGQKKKLLLAKSLSEKSHLYLWDEPLNYIDIFSRIQIQDLILKYCPTIIFVEHDEAFHDKIATKKIYF